MDATVAFPSPSRDNPSADSDSPTERRSSRKMGDNRERAMALALQAVL